MIMHAVFKRNTRSITAEDSGAERVVSVRLTLYLFLLFMASVLLIIAGDHVMERIQSQSGLERCHLVPGYSILLSGSF